MSDHSVLVVEDDAAVSKAIQEGLTLVGYRTRVAGTCSDGLAFVLEEMPDLLLLDIGLPDGDGWSLLEDIRRARPNDDPPIVVMSSDWVSRAQLRERRVHRYVPKPFDMGLLIETVQEVIPRGHLS